MTKITNFKGIDVFINDKGEFYGRFNDEDVKAESLDLFKKKLTRAMKVAKTPVKRVKALKRSWGEGNPVEVEVTSVATDNYGLSGISYHFWTTTTDKEKRREKVRGEDLFKFELDKTKRINEITSQVRELEMERNNLLNSIRYDDESLMKTMGFKKPAEEAV